MAKCRKRRVNICIGEVEPGKTYCRPCLDYDARQMLAIQQRHRDNGMCQYGCGKPLHQGKRVCTSNYLTGKCHTAKHPLLGLKGILQRAARARWPKGKQRPLDHRTPDGKIPRNAAVTKAVKERANGICECGCGVKFPWLDSHHVWSLADGGPDTVENCIALRPDCHRRAERDVEFNNYLAERLERLIGFHQLPILLLPAQSPATQPALAP